jgi:hypothetical protein
MMRNVRSMSSMVALTALTREALNASNESSKLRNLTWPSSFLHSALPIKLVGQSTTDALHRLSKCSRVINSSILASSLPTLSTATIPSDAGGSARGTGGVRRVRELATGQFQVQIACAGTGRHFPPLLRHRHCSST